MKIKSSIIKEFQLLISDKIGLLVMFIMPLSLAIIMSIIQDSAYKIINENKISLIISNNDDGQLGDELIALLDKSNFFELTELPSINSSNTKAALIESNKLSAIYIPSSFSTLLELEASNITTDIISSFSMLEESNNPLVNEEKTKILNEIDFYYDPTLQENYYMNIHGIIMSSLSKILNKLMIKSITENISSNKTHIDMDKIYNPIKINTLAASINNRPPPNTTQHNLPSWAIFAVFFMVVSLGNSVVRERLTGSFLRLKTTPTSYILILSSKMIVYAIAGILQFIFIFYVSIICFKYLNLPPLIFPDSILSLFLVILFCVISAVSYAIMIGSLSKTENQANGIGAVSIIIFAAIGGILVPTFVMPDYLKMISNISPLNWCLEGFYILFLQNGNLYDLIEIFAVLTIFILTCQIITYIKLRSEKLI